MPRRVISHSPAHPGWPPTHRPTPPAPILFLPARWPFECPFGAPWALYVAKVQKEYHRVSGTLRWFEQQRYEAGLADFEGQLGQMRRSAKQQQIQVGWALPALRRAA